MSGEPRFPRESFNREGYERELSGLRKAIKGADASVPMTAAELYELGRLVSKYPDHARRLVDQLPPPTTASPLTQARGR